MKICIFIVGLLILLLPKSVFGQRFHGGPLIGFNASQVDGDTYAGFDKFGLLGGAYVYTQIMEDIDIQLEIKYMSKGARKRTSSEDLSQYKSKLNYIEIPIVLRYTTRSKLGLQGGLGFGYLFSYSVEDSYGTLPSSAIPKFKPFELSSIVGITYPFAPKFVVDLRYSYSLLSIVEVPKIDYSYFRRTGAFNNLFSLGIYYTLGQ